MYVTGGHNGDDFFGELYCLDIESKTWTKVRAYGVPRLRACFSLDPLGNSQILLLGGFGPKEVIRNIECLMEAT